ncbi:hypothetical protein GQ600_10873 [Phytophthora cactorum]|nr:hypothetical protein GQ600_10873 [Phytophthora cactorum]
MEFESDTTSSPPLPPGPTLFKGKRFKDSKTAFYAVQDYALYHNKQVKVARRGGKHRRMVCASTEPCPFFVQLYLHNSKTDHTWYVSSSDLTHSPEWSETELEYYNRLEWIGTTCGPAVENYLRQFSTESWVVAGNIGKVAMYGWRSRTFFETSEQEQQAIAGAGNGLSVGALGLGGSGSVGNSASSLAVAAITSNTDTQAGRSWRRLWMTFERSALAGKWKLNDRKITQGAQDLYNAQCKRIGEYKMDSVIERFAPGYLVENYALAFEGKAVELPLNSAISVDPACTSPTSIPSSRGTKANVSTNGEDLNSAPRRGTKRPASDSTSIVANEAQIVDAEQGRHLNVFGCARSVAAQDIIPGAVQDLL